LGKRTAQITHFNILLTLILRRQFHPLEISPILTPDARIQNGMQFLQKTHNKTHHFVTFFSISLTFVKKVRHFVKKSMFFCHGQHPNPYFQLNIEGALNPQIHKNTTLHTKTHLFGQIILPFYAFSHF